MFGLFKGKRKSDAPRWRNLSPDQRAAVVRKLAHVYNMARYKIVSGFDQSQRE